MGWGTRDLKMVVGKNLNGDYNAGVWQLIQIGRGAESLAFVTG